ncbi:MAG: hypothetical protein ABJB09_04665 [Verrucomicrobiota bacterium]
MKTVVNVEEKIGKTVGRRAIEEPAKYADGLQRLANQANRTMGRALCPKGVYRFHSQEEADAWMMKMLVKNAAAN